MNAYEHLQLVPNSDGSITRLVKLEEIPPTPDLSDPTLVFSKDVTINQSNSTWARIFLPRQALDSPTTFNKLPLLVYVHGGGFILILSPASRYLHDFCFKMASELAVIVVSLEYRLAPEHRLPAAYDDVEEALHWVKTGGDDWLRVYADYSKCFLMGSSAGGNIAYHVGLRAAIDDHLEPLKIRGLILHQPFFGGVGRTESEMRFVNDPILPLVSNDLMWDLSLPIGVDRDHEYSNPTVGGGCRVLQEMAKLGWRVLVSAGECDPLIDRQKEVIKLMKAKGIRVASYIDEEAGHGVEFVKPSWVMTLINTLKSFVVFEPVTEE
ncbi:hypothetical protein K2173_026580 [Erythroxylum novogranatense]|uniref:Alpha/beta hydrolase fold-3 domain-containing protein n=1 Tax=Erythroxylum novogranatense TaxID=1862640 RepID=A0AAV8TWY6_9ROSI|nr:hypothetical protein K2173_026580 [Erythroxylum novogranatense]